MKRLLFSLLFFVAFLTPVWADHDRPVEYSQLPQKAQMFIREYYDSAQISYAKVDSELFDKSYEVVFTNGHSVDFKSDGEWEEIKCPRVSVLSDKLIPYTILEYIKGKYKDANVIGVERKYRGLEVKLNNGLELLFDKHHKLIGIDD